jgi:hypothetical protein
MNRNGFIGLIVFSLFITWTIPNVQAQGCLCDISQLSNLLKNPEQAQSAFLASAKFVKTETILTIEKKWKGVSRQRIRLTGTWTGHLSVCNIPIEKEGTYLVLSTLPASPLMSISACDTIVLPYYEAYQLIQKLDAWIVSR